MRRILRLFLVLVAVTWCGLASAQTTSFESMMNSIIKATPGITNVAISGGVRSTATGTIGVAADGLTIPVATTVSADIGVAALATGAARIGLRAVPYVGAALLIGDIVSHLQGSNITTCPPPDFFCKTATQSSTTQVRGTPFYHQSNSDGSAGSGPTVAGTCGQYVSTKTTIHGGTDHIQYSIVALAEDGQTVAGSSTVGPWCHYQGKLNGSLMTDYTASAQDLGTVYTCPDGTQQQWNFPFCTVTTQAQSAGPATQADLQAQILTQMQANQALMLQMKNEMDAITQANPALAPAVDVTTAPLTVTAPAVTTQPQTISTTTIPNADGSTSTQKVVKTTTVTATQGSPSTVATPNTAFNPVTTTTTSTTNNTTNITTTTTTTVNNPPVTVQSPQTDLKLPTDYNREATQQKILNALNGTDANGMPTAALTNGDKNEQAIETQQSTNIAAVNSISDIGVGITNWFPTIPTAECVNPQVPNPITGAMVDVVVCDKVSMFQTFISGVIAVFCLYGCVGEVTRAMKA